MKRTPSRWLVAVLGVATLVTGSVVVTTVTAQGQVLPYQDPSLPVQDRVDDLLSRMSLDDKIGQMTQVDRSALNPQSDLATYRIGSVLSGGGSAPSPNTPQSWADMYDNFQRIALSTPLGIPMIYGIDAVHGHNNVYGATIFPHNIGLGATRDPELVRRSAGRSPRRCPVPASTGTSRPAYAWRATTAGTAPTSRSARSRSSRAR